MDKPLFHHQRKLAIALGEGKPELQTPEFCNGYVVALLIVREHFCNVGDVFNEQAAYEFDEYTNINAWRKQANK